MEVAQSRGGNKGQRSRSATTDPTGVFQGCVSAHLLAEPLVVSSFSGADATSSNIQMSEQVGGGRRFRGLRSNHTAALQLANSSVWVG